MNSMLQTVLVQSLPKYGNFYDKLDIDDLGRFKAYINANLSELKWFMITPEAIRRRYSVDYVGFDDNNARFFLGTIEEYFSPRNHSILPADANAQFLPVTGLIGRNEFCQAELNLETRIISSPRITDISHYEI